MGLCNETDYHKSFFSFSFGDYFSSIPQALFLSNIFFTNIWRLFQIAYPDQKRVLLISSQASAWWSVNLFKIVRNWLGRIPRVLKKRSCRFARSRSPARSEGIPQSIICFCSHLRGAKGLKNRYTWPRSYGVRLTGTLVPRKGRLRSRKSWLVHSGILISSCNKAHSSISSLNRGQSIGSNTIDSLFMTSTRDVGPTDWRRDASLYVTTGKWGVMRAISRIWLFLGWNHVSISSVWHIRRTLVGFFVEVHFLTSFSISSLQLGLWAISRWRMRKVFFPDILI